MNNNEDTLLVPEPALTPTPVVVPTPVAAPAEAVVIEPKAVNTPGAIILQWLSYAFWGWLILALIWLTGVILATAILGESTSGMVPYAIAAGVVLLPIAFLTDFFYRKREPAKKTGVAMVIMVIHAVLFALLAIVALIAAVFNSLTALIETSSNVDEWLVIIFTAITAALLYAATFVRVLNPFKTNKPAIVYSIAMVVVTLILIVLAIVGPLLQTLATKDDRRIEQNLSSVSQSVNEYIQTNEKLPTNLSDLTYPTDEATLLVQDGIVRYKAEKSVVNKDTRNSVEHRYQLCVTFKEKDASRNNRYPYNSTNNDYSNYPRVSGHGKGEVCYKLGIITQSANSLDATKSVELKESLFN